MRTVATVPRLRIALVDWDLAAATGARLVARPARTCRASRGRAVVARPARAARSTAASPRAGLHRAGRPGRRRSRRRRRPRRPGSAANVDGLRAGCSTRSRSQLVRGRVPAEAVRRGRRRASPACEVGAVLGLAVRQGARPVRGVHGAGRPAGRLLLVAPNIVARRARARGRPARLPALGLPARGDPPRAVRARCRGCATTSSSEIRGLLGRVDLDAARRWPAAASGSAHAPLGACGGDEVSARRAGRRPRSSRSVLDRLTASCRCSRVTPTSSWTTSARRSSRPWPTIRERFQRDAASAGRARRARCAGCSGSTRRCGSTATAPPSSARVVDQVGMDGFNRVWDVARDPAHRARDRTTRRRGSRGSPACSVSRPPAPRGRRRAAARYARCARRTCQPARCVLVACCGGADSLALAAATAFVGAARRRGGSAPSSSTTGCSRARRESRDAAAAGAARRSGSTRSRSSTVQRRRVRAGRGRRPRRPLRRARAGAPTARRGRGPARAHPRRPGRDGAARPGPRLRAPGRWRGWPPVAGCAAGRCSASAARVDARRPCDALGPRRRGHDPHNDDPALRPGPGARRGCCPPSSARSGPASPRRWPAPPTCCATTPTRSTRWRGRASAARRRPSPTPTALDVRSLAALPAAVRARVLRPARRAGGAAGPLTASHVAALDGARRRDWHGQGAVALPGRCQRRAVVWQARLREHRSGPRPSAGERCVDADDMGADLEHDAARRRSRSRRGSPSSPRRSTPTTRGRTSCSSACSRARSW